MLSAPEKEILYLDTYCCAFGAKFTQFSKIALGSPKKTTAKMPKEILHLIETLLGVLMRIAFVLSKN